MGPSSLVANSILAVFSAVQLGLISAMAEEETTVFGVVGEQVILPCINKAKRDDVTWMYNGKLVMKYQTRVLLGSSPMTRRSELSNLEIAKGNGSLKLSKLENSDTGTYSCTFSGTKVRIKLKVFEFTSSSSQYFLEGLNLVLSLKGPSDTQVAWYDNRHVLVTTTDRRELKNNNYSLEIKNLQDVDSGIWKCYIKSSSASLTIPYNVPVIGFHKDNKVFNEDLVYAAVNSSVNFSYRMNAALQQMRRQEHIKGILEWKSEGESKYREKFNFTIMPDKLDLPKQMPSLQFEEMPSSHLQVKVPKVQIQDAGWYRCQLMFKQGSVKRDVHLVVMKVSAEPVELPSKGTNMILTCSVSVAISNMSQLIWEHVNGTEKTQQEPGNTELKVTTKSLGLWKCSCKQNNRVLVSAEYTLVKAAGQNYMWIWLVVGVSPVLLVLAGLFVFTCTARQRRRRRAKRMAQARQNLIERRTCQCQFQMKNGYSSA